MFTSSSVREVMPVVAVDGRPFERGEAAAALQAALRELADGADEAAGVQGDRRAPQRRSYRLSGGKVGGRMEKAPVLLLTVRGRKTGKRRTAPLLYGRRR